MSQVTNTFAPTQNKNISNADVLNDIDMGDFLNLMLAELQNQDPLNPLENDKLIAQISQIREVGATEKLTSTLDAVLLGQNITSATNLIGADIDAISDDNERVSGVVDRITVSNGTPKLHLQKDSGITVSDQAGDLEKGKYRYRIVWSDNNGNLFGVETEQPVELDANGKSVQISSLPVTDKPKQIYRTKAGGEGPYYLVDTLTKGTTGSYLDKKSDADLSGTTLTKTPQIVSDPSRSFEVSLNNVGEIRPPR